MSASFPQPLTRIRLYEQVAEQISGWIREHDLRPGDRLPPERELAARLGVSRATLSQALVALEVIGVEVLARWRRGGRLRRPAEWLPLAEETGLIVEVGRQMFVAARAGMERFDLPVAVNVAARQLDEPDFFFRLLDEFLAANHTDSSDADTGAPTEITPAAMPLQRP